VSIVVVTWRARDYVMRCLESLERHVSIPYEVIVVDDGSTDGTTAAVRGGFPTVRVLPKARNQGLSAGRNSALPLVRGRHVLMLDSDTEVYAGAVETLVARLDGHPEVGLVAPRLFHPDGHIQLSCRRYPPLFRPFLRHGPYAWVNPNPASYRRHVMEDFDHERERPVVWVLGAAQMWRADLRMLIGLYDTRISSYGGEDLDWCLRVWRAGHKVLYVPQAEVMHHWQQVVREKPSIRRSIRVFRDFYYIQWKHRDLRDHPRLQEANA
jgi:N-acetylglucosaminyl-diphospho-decaprenol L-rhamnosyltransferase